MAYSTLELSAEQGRPIELYEFRREGQIWRYTSSDEPVTLSAVTYEPAVIERGTLEQGSEINRTALTLTVQRDLAVVELYQAGPPSDVVTLTLRQVHVDDTEARVLWSGRIITVVTWEGGRAKMTLEPVYTSLRRNGLRRLYQRQCPHLLYGPECKVSNAAFRVTGDAVQINGLVIQVNEVAGYAAGWFSGGYLEWLIAVGIYERRFIEVHSGANLTCTVTPTGLALGTQVRVYPGCNHLLTTCDSKFQNSANYGGMPYIPTKNPFDGSPVY
jgi:uncharacterized phage protein (TIGR02218 family)